MQAIVKDILLVDDSVNDVTLIKNALAEANFGNGIIMTDI